MIYNSFSKVIGIATVVAIAAGVVFLTARSNDVHAQGIVKNSSVIRMTENMAGHMAQMKDLSAVDKLHMKAEMKQQFGDNWKEECNNIMNEIDSTI